MAVRVKICGITRREDAELAVELGAHALGFVFEPTSKRYLPRVPEWISEIPPYVARVAVYGLAPAAFTEPMFHAVQGAAESFGTPEGYQQRIAVVRCGPALRVEDAARAGESADAVLLDAHVDGEYGGTGITVSWRFAAEVVAACTKPVILAGGLTPDNVGDAIRQVEPYAVDVSSGVEASPGVKDRRKLEQFIAAVFRSS